MPSKSQEKESDGIFWGYLITFSKILRHVLEYSEYEYDNYCLLEEEKEVDYEISKYLIGILRNQCRDMADMIERWSV